MGLNYRPELVWKLLVGTRPGNQRPRRGESHRWGGWRRASPSCGATPWWSCQLGDPELRLGRHQVLEVGLQQQCCNKSCHLEPDFISETRTILHMYSRQANKSQCSLNRCHKVAKKPEMTGSVMVLSLFKMWVCTSKKLWNAGTPRSKQVCGLLNHPKST